MMSVRRIPPAPLRKSHWKLTAERNLSPQYPGRQAAFYLKAVSEVSLLVSRRLCPKMYRSAGLAPGLECKTGSVCYVCNLLRSAEVGWVAIIRHHCGFSIAERAARRETDETFETLFST